MSGELPIALRRALVHSPDSELRTRSPDLRPNERPIANSPNSCATFRTRAPTLSPTSRPSDRVRNIPIVFAIAELAFAIAHYLCSHRKTLRLMSRTITATCIPRSFHLLYSTLYIAAPSAKGIPRLVFFGFPFARCAILTFFSIAQYNFGFPFASTIALCFEGCPCSKTSLTRDPTTTTKPARVLYTVFA